MKKASVYRVAGFLLPWTIISITYSQTSTNTAKLKAQPSLKKSFPHLNNQMPPGRMNSTFAMKSAVML